MYEQINEPIDVVMSFTNNRLVPLHFIWRNRFYKIKLVNFVHTSNEGDDLLYHFAVSTETDAYKLTFNTKKMYWLLKEIYSDGFIKSNSLHEEYVPYSKVKSYQSRIKKASYIAHRL